MIHVNGNRLFETICYKETVFYYTASGTIYKKSLNLKLVSKLSRPYT